MAVTFDVSPEKEGSMSNFFYRQFFARPRSVTGVSLKGSTAIVTGASSGLGLETCRQLLGLGVSRLILAVRDEAKGASARTQLTSSSTSGSVEIEVWLLDYGSYTSITAFADRARADLSRLDLVILNAGVFAGWHRLNPSTGHEENLQVNYLSTALLTLLLLPVIRSKSPPGGADSPPGRLTIVSSDVCAWTPFRERGADNLLATLDQGGEGVDMQDRYNISKLLGQFFLSELVSRLPTPSSSGVVVNAVTPGLCYGTDLPRDARLAWKAAVPVWIFFHFLGHSCSVGARNIVDAAVKHGDETHGHYLGTQKLKPMAPIIYTSEGQEVQKRLWDETMAEFSHLNIGDILEQLRK